MTKLLSILLVETNVSLAFRILHMNESLRIGNNEFSYKSSDGLEVKSFQYPEVNPTAIYLRGSSKELDDDICVTRLYNVNPSFLKERAIKALVEFLMEWFDCYITVETHPGYQGETTYNFFEFAGFSQAFTKE